MENSRIIKLERALLGALLGNERLFQTIRGYMSSSDFIDPKNKAVYQAIENVYQSGFEEIEVKLVSQNLRDTKAINIIGSVEYLAELLNEQALESNASNYMREIIDASDLRSVKQKINKISKDIDKDNVSSATDILEKVEMEILNTTRDGEAKDFISAKEGVQEAKDMIDKRATGDIDLGVAIEIPSIDEVTLGFQRGDLIILAARPSMGKTALALNMAANASQNNRVAFFSLEMPSVQLFNRILSFTSNVDGDKLRDPKKLSSQEHNKIYLAQEKISKYNLFVDDTAGIKLSELIWKAKRLHKKEPLDLIVIDYLQLIVASKGSADRQNEVSLISRTLKKLARDLNVPVIALSQLSRKVEARENKKPLMSDLRESGAIEQDADLVAFVYRDSYYNRKDGEQLAKKEVTEFIIGKHRNGVTKTVKLGFTPSTGWFSELGKGDN